MNTITNWQCTGECRWVDRPQYEGKLIHNWTHVLQQKWARRTVTETNDYILNNEEVQWRDVETVTEDENG